MSNRASSSRADPQPPRWYRDRWPWFLIAGPGLVVVASLASAWIAIRSDDGLVADDYYKQGLLINRKLAQMASPPAEVLQATITVGPDGRVLIRLQGPGSSPTHLQLTLTRPGERERPRVVTFVLSGDGQWTGPILEQTYGRWIITLESEIWRLPVTTVAGPLTEIRLATTAQRS